MATEPSHASEIVARPVVVEQLGTTVRVAHGGSIALGTFLVFGPHMGVVRSHERSLAVLDLLFERGAGGVWGAVRRSVRVGAPAVAVDPALWDSLLRQRFPYPIDVGTVRQDEGTARAYVSDLHEWRGLIVGRSGAGKSTLLISLVVASRKRLAEAGPEMGGRPFVLFIDPHSDASGGVRDRDHKVRPNLVDCLDEEVVVVGPGDLACEPTDIPATAIVQMLEDLSPAQKRWASIYVTSEDDHDPLLTLYDPDEQENWPTAFAEISFHGDIPKGMHESLLALRSKLRALLAPPLFDSTGQSTWPHFLGLLSEGRTVVIDINRFPESQQSLLAILVLKTLLDRQFQAMRAGSVLQRGVVIADEAHRFRGAEAAFERFFRESRKAGLALVLGSQRFQEFPPSVLSLATHAIVMRVEGADCLAAVRRFPALKPVTSELRNLPPGSGFVMSDSLALPVNFAEPEMRPRIRRLG